MSKAIDTLYSYINEKFNINQPIIVKELYSIFPDIKRTTIRSIIKVLCDRQLLEKISDGIYALTNPNSILGKSSVYVSDVIDNKYLFNSEGIRVGYESGINFSNRLGLTTQTASLIEVRSNAVADKKREIKIKNRYIIINKSKYEVNARNYKLLQVLDLLANFDTWSEYNIEEAKKKIFIYLEGLELSRKEIEDIVSKYSLEAQVKFYKMGANYDFTQ